MSRSKKLNGSIQLLAEAFSDVITEAMDPLNKSVCDMREDISGIKSDVNDLKSDVSGIKSDVSGIKSDLKTTNENMASQFSDQKRYICEQIDNRLKNR